MHCSAGHDCDPSEFPPGRAKKTYGYCRYHLRERMRRWRRYQFRRAVTQMAQLVARPPVKGRVLGSSPSLGAINDRKSTVKADLDREGGVQIGRLSPSSAEASILAKEWNRSRRALADDGGR